MNLSLIIEQINAFNQDGVILASGSTPDYDDAIVKYQEAIHLARQYEVNPDYLAFSVANKGYAQRQKGEDRSLVLRLLETKLGKMPSLMSEWISKDSSRRESYAGRARLLEESALVRRYTPDAEVVQDLTYALSQINEAVSLYQRASDNAEVEIIPSGEVRSKLWRSYGITSAVATELARNEPSRKREYLGLASSFAQQELAARLMAGETEGFSLLNAYHTLGIVQTELVGEDKTVYDAAKVNLQQAKLLAERANLGLNISTLTFREAWLEYRRDQSDIFAITLLVQQVLDFQQVEAYRWNSGTKKALRQQMIVLGTHLGGQYQQEIDLLYKK